jgi:hypothetical protein
VAIAEAVEEYRDVDGHGADKNIRKSGEQRAKSRNTKLLALGSLLSALPGSVRGG